MWSKYHLRWFQSEWHFATESRDSYITRSILWSLPTLWLASSPFENLDCFSPQDIWYGSTEWDRHESLQRLLIRNCSFLPVTDFCTTWSRGNPLFSFTVARTWRTKILLLEKLEHQFVSRQPSRGCHSLRCSHTLREVYTRPADSTC